MITEGTIEWGEDHIYTLKQIGEKVRENKRRVYVGFGFGEGVRKS